MDMAVKFADGTDNIIRGLAVPFGGPFAGNKDISGEDFGPDTDLCLEWFPDGRPILFHHGLDGAVKTAVVGRQTEIEVDDEGAWVKAQLDKRSRYYSRVKQLIDAQALGFSSGAMPHLVKTRKDGHIERWPWVELSLTPTEANPFGAVYAVKSDVSAFTTDLIDEPGDPGPESFDDQAARVASAVGEFIKRAEARIEVRAAKAGRELSASNRTRLQSLDERLAALSDLRREVQEALSRTDPDAQKAVAELEVELLLSDLRRAGLTV